MTKTRNLKTEEKFNRKLTILNICFSNLKERQITFCSALKSPVSGDNMLETLLLLLLLLYSGLIADFSQYKVVPKIKIQ